MLAPEGAGARQIGAERVRVAAWGLCNERKFDDLVRWVRETLLGDKPGQ